MPVLSLSDRAFFERNGYVIVSQAVPPEQREAAIAAIWEFLGMDPDDPGDWYREPHHPTGMVEMYQHQALWDNRQCPRVHQAFAELWGTDALWVSMDRANMKPPRHPGQPRYDYQGFIHWDADTTRLPLPFGLQGVLCLTDTTEEMGGFQCIPELYRDLEAWVRTQPADRNPHQPDLSGLTITPVPARAGDLIIWHRALAHGNGHNVSGRPRLAQYITMFPARSGDEEARRRRIALWRDRRPPAADWVAGDPRRWEERHGRTAELTELGRRLLGLDLWQPD